MHGNAYFLTNGLRDQRVKWFVYILTTSDNLFVIKCYVFFFNKPATKLSDLANMRTFKWFFHNQINYLRIFSIRSSPMKLLKYAVSYFITFELFSRTICDLEQ